jgi:hypothetical protein
MSKESHPTGPERLKLKKGPLPMRPLRQRGTVLVTIKTTRVKYMCFALLPALLAIYRFTRFGRSPSTAVVLHTRCISACGLRDRFRVLCVAVSVQVLYATDNTSLKRPAI